MAWICGVEEAGRGPVVGPMVMAACWAPDEETVRNVGAKDSKQLTPQQREQIFETLTELKNKRIVDFEILVLSPQEIDAAVEGATDNLNKLELRTSATLVNAALKRHDLSKVTIDCPTRSTQKYGDDVKRLLDKKITVIAENKADENYPVVGAASILAKVTRDREIEKIKQRINVNFGSGYPADPFTQKFLRENYNKKEYASLFRKSWSSYKVLAQRTSQQSLFSFNDDNKDGNDTDAETNKKAQRHAQELKKYEFLLQHGFSPVPPTNQYEVIRLKADDAVLIVYTTGKVVVQGKGKLKTERLLKKQNPK